ncbi:MAG: ParB/RepB/Spo0J family partition protein [Treponema sp.]|jgi:ParB family chromosome partitioning protein|nr:ParB/RepB/Spo0J family partition protein [Treponema sp.]
MGAPKLVNISGIAGMTAGTAVLGKMKNLEEIAVHPVLSKLFPIHDEILRAVAQSIRENGYDKAQPVVLWRGENCVVDGYTRFEAAREAGEKAIAVYEKDFETLDDAKLYAFKRQSQRRNLTQAEIFAAATEINLKGLYERDGTGRATELLAKELGISRGTIEHARTVERRASPEDIEAIKQNEKTINQVYKTVKQENPQEEIPEPYDGEIVFPVFETPPEVQPQPGKEAAANGNKAKRLITADTGAVFDTVIVNVLKVLAEYANWTGCCQILQSRLVENNEAILNKLPGDAAETIRGLLEE